MVICIIFFRVDNVDQASQAKAEIEQKQRNEAEARKERNDVWIPRVNKSIVVEFLKLFKLFIKYYS